MAVPFSEYQKTVGANTSSSSGAVPMSQYTGAQKLTRPQQGPGVSGFLKDVARQSVGRVAATVARPFTADKDTTVNLPILGETQAMRGPLDAPRPGMSPLQSFVRDVADPIGVGAEVASYLPFTRGIVGAAKLGLKGLIKEGAKVGIKEGLAGGILTGAGTGLQDPNATPGSVLKQTAFGAGLGTVGGAVGAPIIAVGARQLGRAGQLLTKEGRELSRTTDIITKREKELDNLFNSYTNLRGIANKGERYGVDIKKALSNSDYLHGSVDTSGTIRTRNPGGSLEQFIRKEIMPNEAGVTQLVAQEGKVVPLSSVEQYLTNIVMKTRNLQGEALTKALSKVESEVKGLALRMDAQGNVPLSIIQEAKITKGITPNYSDPQANLADKAITRGLKELVENNTQTLINGMTVREHNKKMQAFYAVKDMLIALHGKKVEGGRLGKYFAGAIGGVAGGKVGGAIGALAGAELGRAAMGLKMAGKLRGKTGKTVDEALQLSSQAGKRNAIQANTITPTTKAIFPPTILPQVPPRKPSVPQARKLLPAPSNAMPMGGIDAQGRRIDAQGNLIQTPQAKPAARVVPAKKMSYKDKKTGRYARGWTSESGKVNLGGAVGRFSIGSLAGFEKDEEGNWRYNAMKGLAGGVGLMMLGALKTKKFSNTVVHLPQIGNGYWAKIPQKYEKYLIDEVKNIKWRGKDNPHLSQMERILSNPQGQKEISLKKAMELSPSLRRAIARAEKKIRQGGFASISDEGDTYYRGEGKQVRGIPAGMENVGINGKKHKATVNVLGDDATYLAFDEKTASKYGSVSKVSAKLDNPLVLDNSKGYDGDISLFKFMKENGIENPLDPMVQSQGAQAVKNATEKFSRAIRDAGYDGVVVKVGKENSLLQKLFEDDQVVLLGKKKVNPSISPLTTSIAKAKSSGQSFDEWVKGQKIIKESSLFGDTAKIPQRINRYEEDIASLKHQKKTTSPKDNDIKAEIQEEIDDLQDYINKAGKFYDEQTKTRSQLKAEWDKVGGLGKLAPTENLADAKEALRKAKGLSASDIMAKYPDINLKRDVAITDVRGQKKVIPEGEALTPYELKGNKVLLQDGETYIVSKNQWQNIKGQAVSGEAKEFAPELKGTEETVLGNSNSGRTAKTLSPKEYSGDFNGDYGYEIDGQKSKTGYASRRDAKKALDRALEKIEKRDTKYSQYTLPGGENYKEILIKAPKNLDGSLPSYAKAVKEPNGEWSIQVDGIGKASDSYASEKEAIRAYNKGTMAEDSGFKSSHWDEPNVLAHLRMNWRKYKGKAVAFMEELQSDWAREARKSKMQQVDDADLPLDTPDHPLLKNWQTLSVKRALKEAVDSDAEYFAWINGDQTSARYNLATYVENVKWLSTSTGDSKVVRILPKSGSEIRIRLDKDGKITESFNTNGGEFAGWENKKLDEVLGKGLADSIMSKDSGTLSGEGLKFGGEWANNLYDKQVKAIVEDLTGGKVIEMDLGLPISKEGVDQFDAVVKDPDGVFRNKDIKNYLRVGQEINRGATGGDRYIITDILGDGKFKAVPKDKIYAKDSVGTALIADGTYKPIKIGDKEYFYARDVLPTAQSFDISQKTTTQQGILLTPEIRARIRGEAPPMKKPSGKSPLGGLLGRNKNE